MLQQQNPERGFLCSVGLDPEIMVEFQYNPTQLSDKRSINYATINAPAMIMPVRQYSYGGERAISFSVHLDALFKGPADDEIPLAKDADGSIWPELNKYRAFLWPKTRRWQELVARSSFASLYDDPQQFVSPPTCRFGFGENRIIECIVTEVGITETLFNAQLAPLRADVSVTVVELTPYDNLGVTIGEETF